MGDKENRINACIWGEYSPGILEKIFLLKMAY